MVGFFFVRKLIESKKLSRDFAERSLGVTAYPSKGGHIHWLNARRDPDESFDMSSPRKATRTIEDLSNQVIHSYIFLLSLTEVGGLDGILVASDHLRNRELLSIGISDIVDIFELAAKGEDHHTRVFEYNDRRQDYVVRLKRNKSLP